MNTKFEKIKKSKLSLPYISGIILLFIDLGIKAIANKHLPLQEPVKTFLPFLKLYRTHNVGYHFIFGEIKNHTHWALFGIVVVIFLIYSLSKTLIKEAKSKTDRIIYSIIIALMIGSTGNVLEILLLGRATDYFIFNPFPWPSNIADQYINAIIYIMLPIIIIKSIVNWRKEKKSKKVD
jgi:lipoprotein signal peptidase